MEIPEITVRAEGKDQEGITIMNRFVRMLVLTIVIGAAAFITGPKIWPMEHDVPMPPANLLPAYIVFAAVEALAFGFAVAFAVLGWPAIRDLRLGAGRLNKLLFVTLIWFMGNWWFHDNLHMHIGLDMRRLVYVEYGFHGSMLACAVILTLSLVRCASHAEARKQPDHLTESPERLADPAARTSWEDSTPLARNE